MRLVKVCYGSSHYGKKKRTSWCFVSRHSQLSLWTFCDHQLLHDSHMSRNISFTRCVIVIDANSKNSRIDHSFEQFSVVLQKLEMFVSTPNRNILFWGLGHLDAIWWYLKTVNKFSRAQDFFHSFGNSSSYAGTSWLSTQLILLLNKAKWPESYSREISGLKTLHESVNVEQRVLLTSLEENPCLSVADHLCLP